MDTTRAGSGRIEVMSSTCRVLGISRMRWPSRVGALGFDLLQDRRWSQNRRRDAPGECKQSPIAGHERIGAADDRKAEEHTVVWIAARRSALDRMLAGNTGDTITVRRYLDAARLG